VRSCSQLFFLTLRFLEQLCRKEIAVKNSDFGRAAARAVSRLRNVRDEIELAMRPPGAVVTVNRQTAESILNDLGVAACLIRKMAERHDD
jgi:hypothetical protein